MKEVYQNHLKSLLDLLETQKFNTSANDSVRANIGAVAYNQRLLNEKPAASPEGESDFIKKISVIASNYTLSNLPHDIISLQSCQIDSANVENVKNWYFYFKNGELTSNGYNLVNVPCMMIKNQSLSSLSNTELKTNCLEISYTLAEKITKDIVDLLLKEIKETIAFNCLKTENFAKSIIEQIEIADETVKRKCGKPTSFVVVPYWLAKRIKKEIASSWDFENLPLNIRHIGILKNKWSVYTSYYDDVILMGHRGIHHADAGVVYCPHSLFYNPTKKGSNFVLNKSDYLNIVNPDYFIKIALTDFESIMDTIEF